MSDDALLMSDDVCYGEHIQGLAEKVEKLQYVFVYILLHSYFLSECQSWG